MNSITNIFREKKLKLTPQRIAVYKYLQSTKEHPSAETIYKALQTDYPTMSLATVYKALKTLTEVNLVNELNVGEGNFRYDSNVCSHPHIQCVCCGRVDDVENVSFTNLNDKIAEFTDYKVLTNKVYFYGVCKDCADKDNTDF
ncbi:transcriptional regulator PerR [Clostridium pasteurianum DSM 525 = ATCC 6013]|uniref:Ferric uptake regulator, Fur family n=1 Tax=Clostridium pasteurianum DSM 525 = ATCC 6013 TaxID=1262449 RepID=A0A0H3J6D1_CLOPA|nr:Fur family transcriptional regulator [Clostridium pasteurianum]AJA48737.1 transcriptional regulator PerR [Clostridium pasteurianum DSM 525 = ATCC 6013]AJA52725.1 transcriptional regulator PerR [Clostridium pasteurianum DSM 525 = ATCC 6013]AOZ75960.1 transcriptional regulator [Clostridium pasteurianum DSM 525 = ATCC 6013]AOZ79756.1 transcriptional regulator [Clostridium pasteurianum]ELP60036.1 Fur family transcriptional regulator [Clostridium pasteurianum DSM 525 = ATCC 6013]